MADFSLQNFTCSPDHQNVLPGGEMPEELVLVEDSTILLVVSQDLDDKYQGLALCVVFSVEDGSLGETQTSGFFLSSLSDSYESWRAEVVAHPLRIHRNAWLN